MPLEEYSVSSYNSFMQLMDEFSTKNYDRVIACFCGSISENGQSWCPDCRNALPGINTRVSALKSKLENNSVKVAYVFVGIDRAEWKETQDSRFRTDNRILVNSVPTLILWIQAAEISRVVDEDCTNSDALKTIFNL